ncbi:hypothetical protein, partial [Halobacillus litoralis]|uniref:hypothetical protein n=1 Tax=Halobacillus litoralis TaxID=45668 RepID=UPI001CFEB554
RRLLSLKGKEKGWHTASQNPLIIGNLITLKTGNFKPLLTNHSAMGTLDINNICYFFCWLEFTVF